MDFDAIVGQKEIIESLKSSIKQDRVGHAYLFCGPKGIGKKSIALAFARVLLCNEEKDGQSCGSCISCRALESGSSPDLYIINTAEASIGVDEIRDLQNDIVIKPLYSRRKIYLIADADKMTTQAQNCLLKTLEEPPGYAVIILTASNPGALLETILSRSVKYSFKKNTFEEVYGFLKDKYGKNLKNIDFIASFSDGIIGNAKELAESQEFMDLREKSIELLLGLSKSKLIDVFDAFDFFEKNKGNIDTIFDIMILFYRDVLIAKKAKEEKMLINTDKKDIILDNAGVFTTPGLVRSIEAIETARRNLKQNVNFQLSIEVMLMKLQEEYI